MACLSWEKRLVQDMVLVAFAVGGFPTIFLARQKFNRHFRAFCRLADKFGIRIVRVVCVFMCVRKFFVHLVPFVCELFVGEQPRRVENRQIAMFVSYNKTALCRLAFVSNFDFAQISRK